MGGGAALEKAIVPGISVAARLAWPMGPTARKDDRDKMSLGSRWV